MNNKDFEKARHNHLGRELIGIFFSLFLLVATYEFYIMEIYPINLFFGIIGGGLFIVSFMGIINYIESGTNPDKYSLCKRCKCLIKKDRIFCSDCKNSIRISIKRESDKKYFSEYKTLIKQKEKEKKK